MQYPFVIFLTEYDTQDYWVFGICASSRILKNTKEHSVSETGSVSFLGWVVGDTSLLGQLEVSSF
jgi:hypothetical protein